MLLIITNMIKGVGVMIKTIAFAVRPDEMEAFEIFSKDLSVDVELIREGLSLRNVHLTKGYEAVVFFGMCDLSEEVLIKLNSNGVKYISSRSGGYNNVDLKVANQLGIKVSNASYSPNCVADYTVMLILMAVRKMKSIMKRVENNNYSLPGIQGREMHNLTFGVIGTGKIGMTTIRNLSGFGGKILAYSNTEKEEIKDLADYVSFDDLIEQSDVISIHLPLLESTKYILNKETFSKMKKGVVIINTARGELINTDEMIQYIDDRHIGAVAIDVLENELGIFHVDRSNNMEKHHDLAILKSYPNVIVSPHASFYTDQAVSDMVEVALTSIKSFLLTGESSNEVK